MFWRYSGFDKGRGPEPALRTIPKLSRGGSRYRNGKCERLLAKVDMVFRLHTWEVKSQVCSRHFHELHGGGGIQNFSKVVFFFPAAQFVKDVHMECIASIYPSARSPHSLLGWKLNNRCLIFAQNGMRAPTLTLMEISITSHFGFDPFRTIQRNTLGFFERDQIFQAL